MKHQLIAFVLLCLSAALVVTLINVIWRILT
jgi:hypothetical protein